MPKLPEEVVSMLDDEFGPVVLNFVLNTLPEGGAPEHIKSQWLGVRLPVREDNLVGHPTRYLDALSGQARVNSEPVPIIGLEAVIALEEAGLTEAAEYWAPYKLGTFVFRAYEGEFHAP